MSDTKSDTKSSDTKEDNVLEYPTKISYVNEKETVTVKYLFLDSKVNSSYDLPVITNENRKVSKLCQINNNHLLINFSEYFIGLHNQFNGSLPIKEFKLDIQIWNLNSHKIKSDIKSLNIENNPRFIKTINDKITESTSSDKNKKYLLVIII